MHMQRKSSLLYINFPFSISFSTNLTIARQIRVKQFQQYWHRLLISLCNSMAKKNMLLFRYIKPIVNRHTHTQYIIIIFCDELQCHNDQTINDWNSSNLVLNLEYPSYIYVNRIQCVRFMNSYYEFRIFVWVSHIGGRFIIELSIVWSSESP